MSQCTVPNWNVKSQRQEQVGGGGDEDCTNSRSSHVHDHLFPIPRLVPASNYEVTELTWENGQLAMHGLGGFLQTGPTKPPPTWGRANETLESIVHESTISHKLHPQILHHHNHDDQIAPNNISIATTNVASSDHGNNNWVAAAATIKKRSRSESNYHQNYGSEHNNNNSVDRSSCVKYNIQEHEEHQKRHVERSACGSGGATGNTFCRESDATMMTWNSFESPMSRSFKTKTTDDDSACQDGSENQYEERDTKTETGRSQSSRRTRAAAIHNQSERRRRDRINQKMKALQKLVPNASKTDKASMLDEVIEYLKQLQAQVQLMTSSMRNMPNPMMMQMGIQQQQQQQHQLQMSLLAAARMGMGSLGLPHPHLFHQTMASAANPAFVPQPFVVPPIIPSSGAAPRPNPADPGTNNNAVSLPDAYCAFLTQSMNMDFCNKMAALYRQQVSQSTQAASSASLSKDMQHD